MIDPFRRAASMPGPATTAPHPVHPGWPEATGTVVLNDASVLRLRPLTAHDGAEWRRQRIHDEAWLRPVEPTQSTDWASAHSESSWRNTFRQLRDLARRGVIVPMVIDLDGAFAGQVTIGNIQHGAIGEAWIGYWVHSPHMGKGVASAACALGTDHAFRRIGLHRLTATYLPGNPASGKVLATAGYRQEGYLTGNLHIDGRWRDHVLVAQVKGEHPGTCVDRLIRAGRIAAWR